MLILDKTGTITEGSRSATKFIPMQKYTEEDLGQAGFAASIHDTTHEGRSILELSEEKRFLPPLMEKILTAKSIEFSAETRFSGIDFIPNKKITLNKEQQEELAFISKHDKNGNGSHITSPTGKVSKMLLELDQSNKEVKILKGFCRCHTNVIPKCQYKSQ